MPRLFPAPVPHPFISLLSGAVSGEMTSSVKASPMRDGCEEIPGASGEFGRCPDNPIPVDGFGGALTYLDRLHLPDGGTLLFHRLGSFTCRALGAQVVCLEVVGANGQEWDLLFFSLDHPWASHRVPAGYLTQSGDRASEPSVAAGTWNFCPDFPADLFAGAPDTKGATGRNALIPSIAAEAFVRPTDHSQRLARLMLDDTASPLS